MRRAVVKWIAFCAAMILLASAVFAAEITVVGWNVESGGANMGVLAKQIQDLKGIDIWGFCEVLDESWAKTFRQSANKGEDGKYRDIISNTGGHDRLLIVYNTDKFDLLEHSELHYINPGFKVRSPLVARLRAKDGGQEFLFVVNHLYRGNEHARWDQAQLLNEWAKKQTLPIIAVGDYNFDWEVENGEAKHDKGYDNLTAGGTFLWVHPEKLIKTNCDPNYNSVLDFVFLAGAAKGWKASAQILLPEESYCPDGPTKSDHRPVEAKIELP